MGVKSLTAIAPSLIQGQHAAPLLLVQHETDLRFNASMQRYSNKHYLQKRDVRYNTGHILLSEHSLILCCFVNFA